MSHKMHVTIDRFAVQFEVTCDEPEGAECRLACDEACESWLIEHDEEGAFHRVSGWSDDLPLIHRMKDQGECNICLHFGSDPALIPELYAGDPLKIAEFEIKPEWNGDEYEWSKKS